MGSAGNTIRALAIRKVRVPSGTPVFRVTVSPEVEASKGKADCRLRVGVFDGRLHWARDEIVAGTAWIPLACDLAPWAGREVLLLVECSTHAAFDKDFVFLDEMTAVPGG